MFQRTVTICIWAPIFLAVVYLGSWPLRLLFIGLIMLGANEMKNMVEPAGIQVDLPAITLLSCAVFFSQPFSEMSLVWFFFGFLIFLFCKKVLLFPAFSLPSLAMNCFIAMYLIIPFWLACDLRFGEDGLAWILVIAVLTWSYDIFAYLGGYFFGKNHPFPEISPQKSVEGIIAGLLGSISSMIVAAFILDQSIPGFAIMGLFGGLTAQAGDLAESTIKREYGVKDSGRLLPGHGGVLDRFDSFLLVVFIVLIFKHFVL
ncbi:MAG: phosphatidate cytidylyltransferase [Negativicutes bacterium]|nr:phosphatidate cytidylyltransferase [Negativicutes bacterium]